MQKPIPPTKGHVMHFAALLMFFTITGTAGTSLERPGQTWTEERSGRVASLGRGTGDSLRVQESSMYQVLPPTWWMD